MTLRIRRGARSLRTRAFVRAMRRSFRQTRERGDFRLLHYSLQRDHVHLIVEAESHLALASGMKAVGARITRTAHRVFGTSGRLLAGRYHAHLLRTPREVHRALGYVLMNARRHFRKRFGRAPAMIRLDEASSARWFDGFLQSIAHDPADIYEVTTPRSWLARKGWRLHGPLDPGMIPGFR